MDMEKTKIYNVRYGVIVTDYNANRWIIAMTDVADYPLLFLREWFDERDEDGWDIWGELYTLWDKALTIEQAEEILDLLQEGDTRKARSLLKRNMKNNFSIIDQVDPVVLDDMIPDVWYPKVCTPKEGVID